MVDDDAGQASDAAPESDGGLSASQAEKLMLRCIEDARSNAPRLNRDRADWLNLLFYRGGRDNQWVIWDSSANAWVPRGEDPEEGGLPGWMPRSVTNVFATMIDGIVSVLDQSEPAFQFAPGRDEDSDRAAAEVCQAALPAIFEEVGFPHLRNQLHKQIVLTDKVCVLLGYDDDPKWGMGNIDLLTCQECGFTTDPLSAEEAGGCPECGAGEEALGRALDSQGAQVSRPYPIGKLTARLIPSFEFSLSSASRDTREGENPWVLIHSRWSEEDVLRIFGKDPKVRRIVKDRISSQRPTLQRHYADAMQNLSSPVSLSSSGGVATTTTGGQQIQRGPVVYQLYHDPIVTDEFNFPDGLYCVMIGEEVLESELGPLPFVDDQGRPFKPCAIRSFRHAPGSAFGKPPADDLVPLQIKRNTFETLLESIMLHEAAPVTFVPLSVTLEREITGVPGEIVPYRSTIPGEKPERDRGLNPPEGLYKYLELLDQKFQEMSNMNAVLLGMRPEGDPTLGEVQILQERGMAAFREPLSLLVAFEKEFAEKLLIIGRQTMWSPRFRRVMGENGQWEVEQFLMSELEGDVDIQIELASAWPKSPLMQMMRFEKAIALGVLPPPAMNPEIQIKGLELLDLADFTPSMDTDKQQIARELDRWKAARDPMEIAPPNPIKQNLGLHLHYKTQFLKTDDYEQLEQANPPLAMAMAQHVMLIQQMLMQQKMAAQAAQGGGEPAAEGEEGADGSAVDAAVQAGVLRPAGAGGAPLDAAMQSGMLRPMNGQAPQAPSIDDLLEAAILRPSVEGTGSAPVEGQ